MLDDGRNRPVIWITGPPGAGKTTLVASYLESRKVPFFWYQVDSVDGDPASLFHYLAESAPESTGSLPTLAPEYLSDLAGFARRFFRVMFARLAVSTSIVLDNYQDAPAGSSFHRIVALAAEELPPGSCLIAISRNVAPQAFARLLATSRMTTIGWEALRLRLDETRAIAEATGKIEHRVVRMLQDQCGGWAGGLRLMLEELRRTGVVSTLQHPQTLENVFAFLADQVFEAAPPDTRDFLLRTAVLPRMSPRTAQAVSGWSEAGPMLEDLYRRHLFTDRYIGDDLTYQYHPLFLAFLRLRATTTFPADELADLKRRAAALLESDGLLDDAVAVYATAEDWDSIVRIVVTNAAAAMDKGRGHTLRDWIGSLPAARLLRDPWLSYWLGNSLVAVDQEHARLALERAYALFAAEGNVDAQLMCTSGILEARFLQHANHKLVDNWIPVHEKLLGRVTARASAELRLRACSALLIALLYRQPGNPMLAACAAGILELLDSDAGANPKMIGATFLMWYCGYTGKFEIARQVAPLGDALAPREDVTPLNRGTWWNWAGYCRGFLFDAEGAREAARQAIAIGEAHGLTALVFFANYFVGLHEARHGRRETVDRCLKEVMARANPDSRIQTAIKHAFRGWIALSRQQPAQALRSGQLAWEISRQLGSPSYLVHWGTPMIYGLVETGRLGEARTRLTEQQSALANTQIRCFDPMFLGIEATIALREGNPGRTRDLVEPMFRMARENEHGSYLNLLHPWLSDLAAIALEHGIERDYVHELIRLARWEPRSQSMIEWPWTWRIVTLGQFAVFRDTQPIEYGRKSPRKPLALLRALVAAGPGGASESSLADALWADSTADAADKALATAVYRLRTLLGGSDVVLVNDNRVRLNPHRVWVDAWAFESLAADAEDGRGDNRDAQRARALEIYRGSFLAADSDDTWTLSTRERLRAKFIRHAGRLAAQREAAGDFERAADVYRRALEVDDLAESFYQGLLRCCARLDRKAEGIGVYQQLQQTLSSTFGTQPSRESEALLRALAPRS
ncbi:MAG: NACHT domain-containing protein [Burkholderiales bacterium]|nr:NACHT domain-containing protein [Burkholderiales bacterium]